MRTDDTVEGRRKLLSLAGLGVGLGLAAGAAREAQAQQQPGLFASWVHGHAIVLERGIFSPSKAGVQAAFRDRLEWDGDLIDFRNWGAIVASRLGWGARLVVFDYGSGNEQKSGAVWCHYAVPTPVIVSDRRARLRQVLIKHTTGSPQQLAIVAVHVWDGDNRVFAMDNIVGMSPGVFAQALPDQEVLWGMGVSLLVSANAARDVFIDIHAVGIDFTV